MLATEPPPVRTSRPLEATGAGARTLWTADLLRWCRRNQVSLSVPGVRRAAVVTLVVVVLLSPPLVVVLAVAVDAAVATVAGVPGAAAGLVPWWAALAAGASLLSGLLAGRRSSLVGPSDQAALDALQVTRTTVWLARFLAPALVRAVGLTALAAALVALGTAPGDRGRDGLWVWVALPVPAALLGAQLLAHRARTPRSPSWWIGVAAAMSGLAGGRAIGRWFPAAPAPDASTLRALVSRMSAAGAASFAVGAALVTACVLANLFLAATTRRSLDRASEPAVDSRSSRTLRSVLATQVRRGGSSSARTLRRLSAFLTAAAAALAGLALTLPWPLWTGGTTALVGAAGTLALLVALGVVASEGPLVHLRSLRWLTDAGLEPSAVVRRHLQETVLLALGPMALCALALTLLGRAWWCAPATLVVAVGTVVGTCWTDLVDPDREQQVDGGSESGVIGSLMSGLVATVLVAPFALVDPIVALAVDAAAVAGLAVLAHNRLVAEILGPS